MALGALADLRVSALLRWARSLIAEAGCDSPRLDAELLLQEATGVERFRFLVEPERPIRPEEAAGFESLVFRRCNREPVAYLLGRKGFWTFELEVGPGVLVPRPETELLVEYAVGKLQGRPLRTVVDVGCGAAPLSIALALELKPERLIAVDRSPAALAYARKNVQALGLQDCIHLVGGDLLEPFSERLGPIDLLVSNPPYIPSPDIPKTMPEVRVHEPRLALDGGPTGLEISERILRLARRWLAPQGAVLLETGAGLMEQLASLAFQNGFRRLEVFRDLAGIERALWAQKEES